MPISQTEQELVQESFAHLQPDFETHSTLFYEALFRRAPELRDLFRDDLAGQGMKFMTTLGEMIRQIQDPDAAFARYAKLGGLHASLGVTAANFEPMEEALMETLKNAFGDGFTPELEKAWRSVYAEIAAVMTREGGIS